MKKHLLLSLLATLIMFSGFSGCLIEKADTPQTGLTVDSLEIDALATGGVYTIEEASKYKNWRATVEDDYWWCIPAPDDYGKLLTITVRANESKIARSTTVIVTSETTSDTLAVIKVNQAGIPDVEEPPPPPGLSVDLTDFSVAVFTSQYFIRVTSTHPWTADITRGIEWCGLHDAMDEGGLSHVAGEGNGVITLDTKDNETQSGRIATIRVYSEELDKEIIITIWQPANIFLFVEQKSSGIEMPYTGDSKYLDIRSNVEWTVEVTSENSEWCGFSNAYGSGNGTITVTAGPNTEIDARVATVRVTAGADRARWEDIVVWQAGVPYLEVTPTSIAASYARSDYNFSILSNNPWKARVSYSDACIAVGDTLWCTISTASGPEDKDKRMVTATVSRNIEDKERIAYVTVTTTAGSSEVITITQEKPTTDIYFLRMITVPGGTFTMGATPEQPLGFSDEEPAHEVTLSSFKIMEHEVSEGQWQVVMATVGGIERPSAFGRGDNYPVENVSWKDVQLFIKTLNSLTGKNYRLPTEAEWEYAARGGQQSQKFKYSGSNNLGNVAWYFDNSENRDLPGWMRAKHEIRSKDSNELGIFDMTGNVWEWCSDIYAAYSDSTQINPTGPEPDEDETKVVEHVIRGGSWLDMQTYCHVARRNKGLSITYRYAALGLRLVLSVDE